MIVLLILFDCCGFEKVSVRGKCEYYKYFMVTYNSVSYEDWYSHCEYQNAIGIILTMNMLLCESKSVSRFRIDMSGQESVINCF